MERGGYLPSWLWGAIEGLSSPAEDNRLGLWHSYLGFDETDGALV